MKALQAPLTASGDFLRIQQALEKKGTLCGIGEVTGTARLHLIDALSSSFSFCLILTGSELRAREICADYSFFDSDICYFPAKDLIFYEADIHAGEIARERMRTLRKILHARKLTVVTTFSALMTPMVPAEVLRQHVLSVEAGKPLPVKDIAAQLVVAGYTRTHQAETPGQFAIRGDIIDIFDLTADNPVRIELWGDDVESIRIFDRETQRSIERVARVDVFPATEMIVTKAGLKDGFLRIGEEAAKREQDLRDKLHTEEAARIRESIRVLREEIFELSLHVNLDSYIRYFYDRPSFLSDLFRTEDTAVFLDDPSRIAEHAKAVEGEFKESMIHRAELGYILPGQMDLLAGKEESAARLSRFSRCALFGLKDTGIRDLFPGESEDALFVTIPVRQIAPYNNSFDTLVRDLRRYKKEGYRVVILSGQRARARRLVEDFRDHEIEAFYSQDPNRTPQPSEIMTYYGVLSAGFEYPSLRFAVITESDIFTRKHRKKRKKHTGTGERIRDFSDLKVGDYVVHEDHGLGIYRGVEQIEVEKARRDYIRIEYADGGSLYIAATGLSVIEKYAPGAAQKDGAKLKLNKLGTSEWHKTKAKVKTAVDEIAGDLVELYAKRSKVRGYAFGKDTVWQKEFEDAFPYEETSDQETAIAQMKEDMESERVMDRLLCGDVGFGKTEVAIRGAFKAVQDSRQVAVLVPTTILAQQHYNTFVERFRNYPVRIDLLSRFRTRKEITRTLADLKKGLVDIVIGTHRLLSADVGYKDLGLLIVDEEQRFGVRHKEKIKQIRASVDVLTLSATPIPRTLHMSLVGIRDMSLLTEAPSDRLPIQTFVCEQNEATVREAVLRELARHGQVYYVYNRVNTIADVCSHLQTLIPEARIAYAHGQMPEAALEKIMYDFIGGDIDVLVSTVIIETGLDIPNVNTMIVHDSDKMGLAQLYQLRGRVGRSNRTAYAFLMYKRDRILKEVAEKRLNAIREFTDLGSGYKIAMRDLEIRGAGNLLGTRQSGHMASVGYELYCRMLDEALREARGEAAPGTGHFVTNVDLNIDAYIPGTYILNEEQKLEIYKRIAGLTDASEAESMRDELLDRFGDIPASVDNLIRISGIRFRAHALFVTEVKNEGADLLLNMKPDAPLDPAGLPSLIAAHKGKLRFLTGAKPCFVCRIGAPFQTIQGEALLLACETLLTEMERCFLEKETHGATSA